MPQRETIEALALMQRHGRSSEIAPMFVDLPSDDASDVRGQAMVIDGGLS